MATLAGSGIVAYRQVLWNTKSWAETSFTIQKRLLYQEFLFAYGLKSGSYGENEKGQTDNFTDLSALAHPSIELLNLWNDFKKVAWFIEVNKEWLLPLLDRIKKQEKP